MFELPDKESIPVYFMGTIEYVYNELCYKPLNLCIDKTFLI